MGERTFVAELLREGFGLAYNFVEEEMAVGDFEEHLKSYYSEKHCFSYEQLDHVYRVIHWTIFNNGRTPFTYVQPMCEREVAMVRRNGVVFNNNTLLDSALKKYGDYLTCNL